VTRLADIRRYPGSKRHPHFSKESLERSLPATGIEYVHFEELGGRRKPDPDSPNAYWENEQFRAYADYMATAAFAEAVDRLLSSDKPTAVMCAEAVPWRCHRNLLSDDLLRRGVAVIHIVGPGSSKPHAMNEHARVVANHVQYDADQKSLDFRAL